MRLLMVEDHDELAALVHARLSVAGFTADRFGTQELGRLALDAGSYDALILDLGLPDGDGLELLQWLRSRGSTIPVLVLTARSAIADRVTGLAAGADDYLVKPFSADELIARIEALLRRSSAKYDATLQCGAIAWDRRTRSAHIDGHPLAMTPRETELMELLITDAGKVVRKSKIETCFFGLGEDFSSNAVEVSIHRLRRRLEVANAGVEIVTMRGLGYLLRVAT
ncbi:response regulator transcription factor [Blastomonas aquatica]|uniref:DNA-binding response regulator n=1 Tax=Blastomonas aquatica TaxID=1510276 RepID=A0ABQ1JB96_9SPHN|nr:response regulator transcription factor [Blastomonas aquatica]GGB62007.1 DNA-binding response regulator [Blastomonas aquatica]